MSSGCVTTRKGEVCYCRIKMRCLGLRCLCWTGRSWGIGCW